MKKTFWIIIFIFIFVLLLSGCKSSNKLTEEDYDRIAQALANKLEENKEIKNKPEEDNTTKNEINTKDMVINENIENKVVLINNSSENDNKVDSKQLIIDNKQITVKSYERIDRLKDNTNTDIYAYVDALENKDFLKINIIVTNTSNEVKSIKELLSNDLLKLEINTVSYPHMVTMLDKDLSSMEVELKPNESIEGFLAFQVDEKILSENNAMQMSYIFQCVDIVI